MNAQNSNDRSSDNQSGAFTLPKVDLVDKQFLARVFWPLDSLFQLKHDSLNQTLWRCFLLLGIPVLFLLAISWHEDILIIDGNDVGLLEHYGFLTFFIVHILLIVLLRSTIAKFVYALNQVGNMIDLAEVQRQEAGDKVAEILRSIHTLVRGTRFTKAVKLTALMVGLAAVIFNAHNTTRPVEVYGHDVWDSSAHLGGYWSARAYLFFCWGILIPITLHGLFIFCYLIYHIYSMFGKIGPFGVVEVRPLSLDHAGGLRHVNTAIMAVVLNVCVLPLFTISLLLVHGITRPVVIGTIAWIIFGCCIFFVPLSSVRVAMSKRKRMILGEIEGWFNHSHDDFRKSFVGMDSKHSGIKANILQSMHYLYVTYGIADRMPVWPFDIKGLLKLVSVVALQVLTATISFLSQMGNSG